MLIILPRLDETTLEKVEKSLSHSTLNSLDLQPEQVQIHLPKFNFTSNINLKDQLKKLEVNLLFTLSADASGISDLPLYVTSSTHKTTITLTEQGTKAAAATEFNIGLGAMPSNAKLFKADHPFIYIIKHGETIIFIGRVANPSVTN